MRKPNWDWLKNKTNRTALVGAVFTIGNVLFPDLIPPAVETSAYVIIGALVAIFMRQGVEKANNNK